MLEILRRSIDISYGYQYNFGQNATDGILPPPSSSAWMGLVKLFQRDWFFRVWVIQEAVNATKVSVACGSESVSWDLIVEVSQACQKNGYLGGYTVDNVTAGTHSAAVINLLKNKARRPL